MKRMTEQKENRFIAIKEEFIVTTLAAAKQFRAKRKAAIEKYLADQKIKQK